MPEQFSRIWHCLERQDLTQARQWLEAMPAADGPSLAWRCLLQGELLRREGSAAAAEQQRDRLMQLIREQIAKTREQIGANVLTVTGLDSPVLVRQLDHLSVELYLDYQLSATLEK